MSQDKTEKIIQTLERYYDAALKREDVWDFFMLLSDYIGFIKRTPQLERLVNKLLEQKAPYFKSVERYEKQTKKELDLAEKKLLKIVTNNKLSSDALNRILKDLAWYKKGRIQQSGIPTDHLDSYLFDIAKEIKLIDQNLVSSFEDPNRKPQNIYGNFVFSKSLDLRNKATKELEQQREVEIWGAWDYLSLIGKDLFVWQDWHREFPLVDQQLIYEWVELKNMLKERKDSPARIGHLAIRNDEAEFQRSKQESFGQYLSRIHNFLLEELNKGEGNISGKTSDHITIFLNQFGELFREPRAKYCYAMGEKSARHKVVRFLIQNSGYQPTKLIAVEAENKNEQTTRTEIRKIRDNIKKFLKISGKDYLQGKKESGYRINPRYKTTLKIE